MWCWDRNGSRITPLSQAVWSSNCLVEGGLTPLGLDVISQLRDNPSLDLRMQGPPNQTNTWFKDDPLRNTSRHPYSNVFTLVCNVRRYYTSYTAKSALLCHHPSWPQKRTAASMPRPQLVAGRSRMSC